MELSFLQSVLIIIGLCLTIGIPLLMYLNGNFTYTDTVISEREYRKETANFMGREVNHIRRVVIERRYDSGKIKHITREFEI